MPQASDKSGAMTLALSIPALPVLFVLLFPPLLILPNRRQSAGGGSIHHHPFPSWMRHPARTWIYLENETFLCEPLESYLTLWERWAGP